MTTPLESEDRPLKHHRVISVRMPDDTLHAVSKYLEELIHRDRKPYKRSAVILFLLETQLHQQKRLLRLPTLRNPGLRRSAKKSKSELEQQTLQLLTENQHLQRQLNRITRNKKLKK